MEERCDVCIVGAGPAGYAAAMRAHDLGKRVVLVERAKVGGAGIHAGALSSKTFWHLSNDYGRVRRTDRGYRASDVDVSYSAVMQEVRAAVSERRAQLERQLERLTEQGSLRFVRGNARFVSPHAVEVVSEGGALTLVTADYFLVATGSSPRAPEGIEIDGERIVTSDHIEAWSAFPESLVVVGAGVIGCEYATCFANFGKTKIFLIDKAPRILPFEDADVAEVVTNGFEKKGVTIHKESRLVSMRVKDGLVEYVVEDPRGSQTIRTERALVSIGRAPNLAGLGLEEIGVRIERGSVVANDTQTTVPHVFAAGDATMDVALVNVAELEGRHAIERMFGESPPPLRYEALSAIMFLDPEVASVGLNEIAAKKKGIPYRVAVLKNSLVNRNIAMRETRGFVKLLVEHAPPHRVLGLRVVGPQASSTIQGVAFLIDHQATVQDIEQCVHPHPAITEGVQECARMISGRSIMKTGVFGHEDLMRCGEG